MAWSWVIAAATATALAVGVGGCHGCRQHAKPNILVVTIDTLRSDHCSSYGYDALTTPQLDRMAATGLLFETAYAPIPVTGPSHASLLTGMVPRAHGVVRNGYVLDATHPTLGELLQAEGYVTAAIVSAFPLDRRFGLARGFEHYDDDFAPADSSLPSPQWEGLPLGQPYDRRARATTGRALRWLQSVGRATPFFLWVHYFDPHSPYDPPAGFRPDVRPGLSDATRRILLYDGEIRYTDHELGRLLDAIDADRTLTIVTADHGEGLGQHGVLEHGPVIYDEAVRVPLVIRWPGHVPSGLRIPGPVSLVDVMPSILGLVGVEPGSGRRALPGLDGSRSGAAADVFLQAEQGSEAGSLVFGVRSGVWKYIETREAGNRIRQELYDVGNDRSEDLDLSQDHSARATRLGRKLGGWRRQLGPVRQQEVQAGAVDGLKALGYMDDE